MTQNLKNAVNRVTEFVFPISAHDVEKQRLQQRRSGRTMLNICFAIRTVHYTNHCFMSFYGTDFHFYLNMKN